MKKIASIIAISVLGGFLSACDDADFVSHNISRAADNFKIMRRIVFVNTWTDTYLLSIEGRCSIKPGLETESVSVICKVGPDKYKKHYLGLSNNVTWFAEQLDSAYANAYHYRVTFKPQSILPDIDFRGNAKELLTNKN